MNIPEDLMYTKDHEWVRIDGDVALIGITDYAQDQLGEIVFVELPQEDEEFSRGDPFGVVESVKAVNDILLPITGKICELNDPLTDSPEILNDDPYGEGWMVKAYIIDKSELDDLLSAAEYEAYVREEV
jgi:glycine cleavage system H protein